MMYQMYQAQADLMGMGRDVARSVSRLLQGTGPDGRAHPALRPAAAALDLFGHARLTHHHPGFGLREVMVGNRPRTVVEEVALDGPFGTLLRFAKEDAPPQPKVLVAAPMSGHFATLLRGTVAALLPDHDVYVTDWKNPRDVPRAAGRFGLDEYVEAVMGYMRHLGPGGHVLAVCQPAPAVLAAVSLLAEDGDPACPRSMTLMAGPIDTRIRPTRVNRLAGERPLAWFERNMISTVPWPHAGAGRRVYPGFLQIAAFMSMNLDRHLSAHLAQYRQSVWGEAEGAAAHRAFYDEYLAVMDLPAEFYLETIGAIFQEHRLPRGEMTWRGRPVRPEAIRRTALLTVEGELDDICAVGQTMAAHDLCSGLRPAQRRHHLQTGAGHYGVFNGRRWTREIYPLVREMIQSVH